MKVEITKTVLTLAEQRARRTPPCAVRSRQREHVLSGSRMKEQRVNQLKTLEKSF